MNFKRVLTMLLALCLIVNMAVPGVSALTAGENEYVAGQNPTASEKTAQGERINITTLKNAVQAKPAATAEGKWTAQQVDVEADLLKAELPQGVKELREAAELYEADEVVPAFIVLEDKPLAETSVSIQAVPADKEARMLAQQNKLIGTISRKVLKAELDVRYQFTYLSNAITANVPFGALAEIAELPGVKTVFLMPVYDKCVTSAPNTATAGEMIGVPSVWEDLQVTGAGMKIAIVSHKPQTTRTNIRTIYNTEDTQIIFTDTPGIHKAKNKLGEYMVNVAEGTLAVDGQVSLLLQLVVHVPNDLIGFGAADTHDLSHFCSGDKLCLHL